MKLELITFSLAGFLLFLNIETAFADQRDMSRIPAISTEFLQSYHHRNPSGHLNEGCRINRLGNIGIDARQFKSPVDLDLLTDREYRYIGETSDEGWLVAGGEHEKLNRPDSGHAEIWRVGPDSYEFGGIPYYIVDKVMRKIKFGPLYLKPLKVNYTPGGELELLFSFDPESTIGQLYRTLTSLLQCPCGDYGNPFHITLARGVKFRSDSTQKKYFEHVDKIVAQWQQSYPKGITFGDGGVSLFANRETILESYSPSLEQGVQVDMSALQNLPNYQYGNSGVH